MEQDRTLTAQRLELDEATQAEFIHIIEAVLAGKILTEREANMLFFWIRHQDDPEFSFVPAEYKTKGGK